MPQFPQLSNKINNRSTPLGYCDKTILHIKYMENAWPGFWAVLSHLTRSQRVCFLSYSVFMCELWVKNRILPVIPYFLVPGRPHVVIPDNAVRWFECLLPLELHSSKSHFQLLLRQSGGSKTGNKNGKTTIRTYSHFSFSEVQNIQGDNYVQGDNYQWTQTVYNVLF